MKHNILLVDDDDNILESTQRFLKSEGFGVRTAQSGEEAIALVRQNVIPFSIALIDYHMPDLNGPQVIEKLRALDSKLQILGFSGDDTAEAHNSALDSGASFFIEKDIKEAKLLGILHRICREVELRTKPLVLFNESENANLIASIGMIGVSNSLARVAELVHKYAPSKEAVLIRGENGTGKEKVAKAIHNLSSRANRPFIAVNCAAIPGDLIESELFGHEKGAFTGAARARIGYFQAANNGTIFLDEIGDMPLHLQATLLRVLQEKIITPVGSTESKKIDFRLIAATNAPLEELIEKKNFREDLFYRLSALPILLSPLRERPEDIPFLASAFLDKINAERTEKKVLLESTVEEMKKRAWRGNVRELEHCVVRMASLAENSTLDSSLLGAEKLQPSVCSDQMEKASDLMALRSINEEKEKALIVQTLSGSSTITAAARVLGLSRTTLRDKIKRLGIKIKTNEPEEVIL